jgi:NAD(P)H-dependent FMN reductase
MDKLRVAIILGSTRPGRNGEAVARWVHEQAQQREDASYTLVDLKDFELPLLDEPQPPSMGHYTRPHTRRWSECIAGFDAFVFVTPEYNHGTSAALKNALDYLYAEWNDKAAGFVSYGSDGGTRAVEHLRATMGELQIADVRAQVALELGVDFENYRVFKPTPPRAKKLAQLFDQVVSWGTAMRDVRAKKQEQKPK